MKDANHTVTDNFIFFWGGPFSQWASTSFTLKGPTYNCAEQYMMAMKAQLFKDEDACKRIMESKDPRQQKSIGREVKNFNTETWSQYSFSFVVAANVAKFSQNEEFKKVLLESGDRIIVEASPQDKIWGIGLGEFDRRSRNPALWQGQNLLGLALMVTRNHIKNKGEKNEKTISNVTM